MEVTNKQLIAAIELYKSAETDEVRDQAITIIESMANQGDVTACLILGVNYDPAKDKGFVTRDITKALSWYTKAADLGDPKGANEAAIMYFKGGEEVEDKEQAAKYIKMAVDAAPDNETYQRNYDVIIGKPKLAIADRECEDEAPAESQSTTAVSGQIAGEKVIAEGAASGMMALDIILAAVVVGLGVLMYFLSVFSGWQLVAYVALVVMLFVMNLQMLGCHVTVTNRRVTGQASFQRAVDLPIDSISSVGTCAFGAVKVTAPSCKAVFYSVKNSDEVRRAIVTLLVERQDNARKPVAVYQEQSEEYTQDANMLAELVQHPKAPAEEFEALSGNIMNL